MNKRIKELDGLRAISVAFVVIAHLAAGARAFPSYIAPGLAHLAPIGVQVFFVISGFVITRLQLDEKAVTGRVSLVKFYIRRYFRIIPAFWTYLLAVLLIAWAGEISLNGTCVLTSMLFLSNIINNFTWPEMWFVSHSWTLSVEEQYYLLLPFTMWVLLRGNRTIIIISMWLLYFLACYSIKIAVSTPLQFLSYFNVFRFIIAGVILALLWPRVSPKLKGITPFLPIALIIFIIAKTTLTGFAQVLITKINTPVEAAAYALTIGWLIQNPDKCGFLRHGILQWLGKCSYSLYLWQELFTGAPEFYGRYKLSDPRYGMALLLIAGALSYYLIERHSMALGKKICSMF